VARKLTDTVKLQVRLSERLRRRLEQAAKHNDWSMNTEIVNRLDLSFQQKDQQKDQEEMIRSAVKSTAGAAVVRTLSELHLLPQQPPGKPQLSDEEQTRLSADKDEKSNKEEKSK
jgi:Arc-like DNA binding domain